MVVFNYAARELTAKVVYYGPGLCGKTTNLEFIHKKLPPAKRGQMMSLATETDRTLFFDLLPVDLGNIGGFAVRLQLFTVPGQTYYNTTRKMVLRGSDGVIFVADSRAEQLEANIESIKNLKENLAENDIDYNTIPLVIQFNKQDLSPLSSDEELNNAINERNAPTVKAVAFKGIGVVETFKACSQVVINNLKDKVGKGAPGAAPPPQPARPRADSAQIKVKTEKSHVPAHAGASDEQIHRESSLEQHGIKSPTLTVESWINLSKGGIEGMDTPEAINMIQNVKKGLVNIIESNKKLNLQYEDLFRSLDKLAVAIKSTKEEK